MSAADAQKPAVVEEEQEQAAEKSLSFEELGLCEPLREACQAIGWSAPTAIQQETLPVALEGRDIIGLAETGSGKTGAFALPVLQALLDKPQRLFAVVLAPTRELAFQISEQFEALGSVVGLKTAVIIGGIDMMTQAIALAKKPHIIIATPGRLVDHLENTKGFSLRSIKYLVLDEADKMLSMDFEEEITKILQGVPRERTTYLFSATMTSKVAKLQRASLQNPVKLEVSSKYATVSTLVQQYCFLPSKYKDCYLAYILNEFSGQTVIVFVGTCAAGERAAYMLKNLGFGAVCLHGQMSQSKRLNALNKFKSKAKNILLATDVASRGLDIPAVDLVLNYDIPSNGKDYIHRVGRTARAGRSGRAISLVTQYDVEVYQRLEQLVGKKLPEYECDEETVLVLLERVTEAQRLAAIEIREANMKQKGKRKRGQFDDAGGEHAAAAAVIDESSAKRKMLARAVQRNKGGGRGGGGGGGGRGRGRGRGRGGRR